MTDPTQYAIESLADLMFSQRRSLAALKTARWFLKKTEKCLGKSLGDVARDLTRPTLHWAADGLSVDLLIGSRAQLMKLIANKNTDIENIIGLEVLGYLFDHNLIDDWEIVEAIFDRFPITEEQTAKAVKAVSERNDDLAVELLKEMNALPIVAKLIVRQ
jgi:hypothetical protein